MFKPKARAKTLFSIDGFTFFNIDLWGDDQILVFIKGD